MTSCQSFPFSGHSTPPIFFSTSLANLPKFPRRGNWGVRALSITRGAYIDKSPAEKPGPPKFKRLRVFTIRRPKNLVKASKARCPGHLFKNLIDVGPSKDIPVRIALPELAVSGLSELLSQSVIFSPFSLIGENRIRLVQILSFFRLQKDSRAFLSG